MKINFRDKTVVVTGAASGIGWHTAKLFGEDGAYVIALDIQKAAQPALDNVQNIQCDVSNPEAVQMAFEEIKKNNSAIDILINNAGIQTYGDVVETTVEDWDNTFDVNLKSVFLCSKYAIPLMQASSHPVIVNVSSAQSFVSQRKVAAYAVSKAGINALTRCMAIDFSPHLRCVAVCPGAVYTPMLEEDIAGFDNRDEIIKETEEIHLLNRIASPQEIAQFILLLASEEASFATGHVYRVDGGIGLRIEGT